MKKVLFATTALVASAGIASAQGVELSGFAEMGIIGGDGIETQFHHDIDVKFSMSGETDNGLTFGATIDLDEVSGGIANTANPSSVYISGSFGTLTMGDTDGAFDWALSEVAIGSAINDDHTAHAGYSGNSSFDGVFDGQIARYDYSFGDFAFAVSAELDDTGVEDPAFQIGGRYTTDVGGVNLAIGLGYGDAVASDEVGVSVRAKFAGGFEAIFNYTDFGGAGVSADHSGIGGFAAAGPDAVLGTADDNTFDSHMAIGLGYSMDALTIGVNYGEFSSTGICATCADASGYGIAVNYDLGGGAVAQFGYGRSDVQNTLVPGATASTDTFSLGLAMSF